MSKDELIATKISFYNFLVSQICTQTPQITSNIQIEMPFQSSKQKVQLYSLQNDFNVIK